MPRGPPAVKRTADFGLDFPLSLAPRTAAGSGAADGGAGAGTGPGALLRLAGGADLQGAAAQGSPGHALDDLRLEARGHLDEGEAVVDVDGADLPAGDAGLVGDGADDVGRPHAGEPP